MFAKYFYVIFPQIRYGYHSFNSISIKMNFIFASIKCDKMHNKIGICSQNTFALPMLQSKRLTSSGDDFSKPDFDSQMKEL